MMLPTFYFLQVILCSAILFLYYHIALRNRLFHQWNRFYLLAVVVLSLSLPALDWTVGEPEEVIPVGGVVTAILDARSTMQVVILEPENRFSAKDLILPAYLLVSFLLLLFLVISISKILLIIRTSKFTKAGKVYVVDSDMPGTPFSFFRYIFWNKEIDIESETGSRIVKHEMVHVQEWHSVDKLFMQLVLTGFWINPFFWLIRRELRSIHEFIADQKSTDHEGSAALAAMILESSFHKNSSFLTNQFFHTSIKRRIAMITKSNSKVNYFTRVLALPVIAVIAFAFTVKSGVSEYEQAEKSSVSIIMDTDLPVVANQDTVPSKKKIERMDFLKDGRVLIYFEKGQSASFEVSRWEWVVKDGYISQEEANKRIAEVKNSKDPLIVVNGEAKPEHTVKSSYIFKKEAEEIKTLSAEEATVKYGDKGKNGAIEIIAPVQEPPAPVFVKVEVEAKIDDAEWKRFLLENTQSVMDKLASKGKPGKYTIIMQLLVEADGRVSDVYSIYDYGLGVGELLIPILMKSPQWKPAMQNGRRVRSYIKQPITFIIAEENNKIGATLPTHDPETIKKMTLHQLLGVNDTDDVISCIISMDLPNWDIIEVRNSGNSFSDAARNLIDKADKGLLITIDAIQIKKEDGSPKKMPAKVYKM